MLLLWQLLANYSRGKENWGMLYSCTVAVKIDDLVNTEKVIRCLPRVTCGYQRRGRLVQKN